VLKVPLNANQPISLNPQQTNSRKYFMYLEFNAYRRKYF